MEITMLPSVMRIIFAMILVCLILIGFIAVMLLHIETKIINRLEMVEVKEDDEEIEIL